MVKAPYFREFKALFLLPVFMPEALVKGLFGFYISSSGTTYAGLLFTFWSHVILFEFAWARARPFVTTLKDSTICAA